MSELWKYFKPEYWEYFQQNVVENELPKNIDFFNELREVSPFEDDINRALASLSPNMFRNDIQNFRKWLNKKIPALNGKTPNEISNHEKGMDWMREFILRS